MMIWRFWCCVTRVRAPAFGKNRPGLFLFRPQLVASFSSNQACNVGYWHIADNPAAPAFVRYWGNNGHAERVLANLKAELLRMLLRSARAAQGITCKMVQQNGARHVYRLTKRCA